MNNHEALKKLKRVAELFVEIEKDNNLVTQDLKRHAQLVAEARNLLSQDDVIGLTSSVEEILILVDINKGFTSEGVYQNPYLEAIVEPVNEVAHEFHDAPNKLIIVLNEGHTEDSQEFKTLNPNNPLPHCIKGTSEAEYAPALAWLLAIYPVFEKNCTMAALAPGYLNFYHLFPNLRRVYGTGGITPMCYLEERMSTIKFFDQNNLDVEVVALEGLYDTYQAPWHERDEWNAMSERFMTQAGIKLERKRKIGEN